LAFLDDLDRAAADLGDRKVMQFAHAGVLCAQE
jgi:hypothetical protein